MEYPPPSATWPIPPELVSFGLLLGHLVGEYIAQNDWMAKNKSNPHPGPPPKGHTLFKAGHRGVLKVEDSRKIVEWGEKDWAYGVGHVACTIHCLLYTASVWFYSPWLAWWALLIIFITHWPIDRFRLAACWMKTRLAGQKAFSSPESPFYPWSVILVDNIFHLIVLYSVAVCQLAFFS